MKGKITITGEEIVIKNLGKVSKEVQAGLEKALIAGGFMIHNDAKLNCPVKTGRLRGSESVNWSGSGMSHGKVDSSGFVEKKGSEPLTPKDGVGQPAQEPSKFWVVVGTNVEYGPEVEERTFYQSEAFDSNKTKIQAMLVKAARQKLARI